MSENLDYSLKRSQLATLVNDSEVVKRIGRISAAKIDNYRTARIIPSRLYDRPSRNSRIGYKYAREAVDWVLLGWQLEKAIGFTVADTGIILDSYLNRYGDDLSVINELLHLDKSEFTKRLRDRGVDLSDLE